MGLKSQNILLQYYHKKLPNVAGVPNYEQEVQSLGVQ